MKNQEAAGIAVKRQEVDNAGKGLSDPNYPKRNRRHLGVIGRGPGPNYLNEPMMPSSVEISLRRPRPFVKHSSWEKRASILPVIE